MITLLIFILIIAMLFGGFGGNTFGTWSPAGLILLVLILYFFFGNGTGHYHHFRL
jgi:hypothetical protein